MFCIAKVWDQSEPSIDIKPDRTKVIEWLRTTFAAARPDAPLWFRARFFLEGRIRYDSLDEAHGLLDEILGNNPGPVDEARAWCEKQQLCAFFPEG